jgi:GTPase SAR1 family protein
VPHDEKEPETPGIERHPLPIMAGKSKIIAHIWDFGGQEFLHQTHQFFFSERSIYVVVLSGRQGRSMQEAEYWLRLIRTYGTGSPVVIALNQIQSHPFTVDEHFLQENYPEVKAVVKTDCDPRIGIEVLRRLLGKLAGAMPSVRERIDPAWSRVRTHLEEMTESFVTFAGYRVICARNGVATPEKQEALAAILDCLGIALNYREDARLRDTSVLKPRWLVDGIYSSLRWLHKQKTNGEMRLGDFPRALKDTKTYPEAMHQFLLALMEKFELCFPVEDEDGLYLVPALLDANQPRELKKFMMPAARRIQFRYEDVRPPGLLPLFICYAHTNERTVRQLIPSLKVLARRGYVAPWRDADLVPGEDWDETIKERLSNAKVILLMVSRDFLASDYITPQERPLAMSLMEGEKAVVVPVLLSPCSWREEDFARLEKLPRKDEPVSLFSPRENAWVLVEDGIKAAVERARGFSESREFKFRGLPEDRLARGWG